VLSAIKARFQGNILQNKRLMFTGCDPSGSGQKPKSEILGCEVELDERAVCKLVQLDCEQNVAGYAGKEEGTSGALRWLLK